MAMGQQAKESSTGSLRKRWEMYGNPLKVSIVLPTHNRAKFLRQSVDSCLNQTHNNIELIIVNDGSTDNTEEIIKEYTDKRLKYIKNESNIGIANSLNRGFGQSAGAYLTWTSDDNAYLKNAIEEMVRELETNRKIDFVYANRYEIDENGRIVGKRKAKPPEGLDIDNCIGSCFLYRRRVYEEMGGYDPSAFLAEDYEYWLRIRSKFKMKWLNKYLYLSRFHQDALRNKYPSEVVKSGRRIRNKYISNPSKADYFTAEEYFQEGDKKNCILYLKRSFSRNLFNPPAVRLLMVVMLPDPVVRVMRSIKQKFFG